MSESDEVTTSPYLHPGMFIPETHEQAIQRLLAQTNERLAELTEAVKVLAATKPDADGWIKHDGGPRPVYGYDKVQVRFRSGEIGGGKDARDHKWSHHFATSPGDIVAWRRA
ncbi:MAG: hypothetical protein IM650_02465 [Phenylobacterium sp.]|uniref:hypothetical protein n=1 Tax=Phenylobacterium sp. TaxID=1871053 RepID=UPI0025D84133|nr:hypothetical protein [Phenylobacterium sp.]MCA6256946.1 hypothetical protein [Phenylobacterium sp.]MCA6270604.1 hypothetical protein [Phenylobacterium sp.]MCA6281390.1 hypothetical protein [Phenylobacterium sp.]MCA6303795.1 hypothetical protein [Phenylobacterium sp.]